MILEELARYKRALTLISQYNTIRKTVPGSVLRRVAKIANNALYPIKDKSRKCARCGVDISHVHGNSKYCSQKCRAENAVRRPKKVAIFDLES